LGFDLDLDLDLDLFFGRLGSESGSGARPASIPNSLACTGPGVNDSKNSVASPIDLTMTILL
jgi:hypothetical protein